MNEQSNGEQSTSPTVTAVGMHEAISLERMGNSPICGTQLTFNKGGLSVDFMRK